MNRNQDAGSLSRPPRVNVDLNASNEHLSLTQRKQGGDPATRRRWPRFAVRMPVQVRVTTQGPTRVLTCEGQGTDISCGGLAVTMDLDLAVGAQIGVEFIPPHADQPMRFRCFVRNRDGHRYGVEFITENDEDYQRVGELQTVFEGMTPDVPLS